MKELAIFAVILFGGILVSAGLSDVGTSSPTAPVVEAEAFYPEATNYAVDAAGALSADQLASLNSLLKENKTEIGVAVVKSTKPLQIEEYGIKLAEKWKVGDAEKDNGAIIIIATEDRKVRIEVGYGLEGSITDAEAGRIIDEFMIDSLKKGDWYGAIIGAINGINSKSDETI